MSLWVDVFGDCFLLSDNNKILIYLINECFNNFKCFNFYMLNRIDFYC